ncbi:MAG: hypothetical protein K2N87_06105 [Eubacterium sp.]|nr:hypothetical protein [Eubacterium sp.]
MEYKPVVLLFQDTKDRKLKNGWRNGPIYVLEIVLYSDAYEEPMIELAKFEYENIRDFSPGVSPASYWHFTEPLYDVEYDELEDEILVAEMPEEVSRKHWGVNRIVCKVCPLVDINRENTYEMIFGTFQKLKNI